MATETRDPRVVIRAQKRVLRLAMRIIGRSLPPALYTDGKGLWTKEELLDHMRQAIDLKVQRAK